MLTALRIDNRTLIDAVRDQFGSELDLSDKQVSHEPKGNISRFLEQNEVSLFSYVKSSDHYGCRNDEDKMRGIYFGPDLSE